MKSLAHDWPRCVIRAAAAIQQLDATVPSPQSAFSERNEARRWLLAAQEAATRHCSETVVAYLAYRTEWFAQSAATRILDEQRARPGEHRRETLDSPLAAIDATPA